MQFVMHLVETKLKQNAKASKINAFTKNGVDPIARSNNKRRLPKGSLFCYSEWRDEEPRKSGADKDERRTKVRRRGETERGRSGNAYHLRI